MTVPVVLIIGVKALVGVTAYILILANGDWDWSRHGMHSAQLLLRMSAGCLLLFSGYHDRRCWLFGVALLAASTSYANRGLVYLATEHSQNWALVVNAIRLDALLPYFFWRFARVFPASFITRKQDAFLNIVERLTLLLVIALVACNFVYDFLPAASGLAVIDASNPTSLYHVLIYGLTFAALVLLIYRTRTARELERRRVKVFVLGLVVSMAPPLLFIVATSISDELTRLVRETSTGALFIPLMQAFFLTMPVLTAYAMLVERVLPIHILLRQTVRFSLGHGFVFLLITFPLLVFIYYLYVFRAESLATITQGLNGFYLLVSLAFSGFFFFRRHSAHRYLENQFFRAKYDANSLLAALSRNSNSATSLAALSGQAQTAVNQALHPETSYTLFNTRDGRLHDPQGKLADLSTTSPFGQFLTTFDRHVFTGQLTSPLSESEKRWLEQADVTLMLPIKSGKGNNGVILLGDKKSELNYTSSDTDYLELVATTISPFVDRLMEASPDQGFSQTARQCQNCGLLRITGDSCPDCGFEGVETALLPQILHGHYEVTRALAKGGMGVVYLARDTRLARTVVLKTVISATTDELAFIRQEAKLMAALSHPGIATIYGYESFQSIPILVCEYLENGTLQDLLKNGFLVREEVLNIIAQIANALDYLHRRGIVHGDVKPDNIGFDAEEQPKLLDFGLAGAAKMDGAVLALDLEGGGTIGYMSPELIAEGKRDQSSDLWALSVTFYEALHGINPFLGSDIEQTIARINQSDSIMLNAPTDTRSFFQIVLAHDPHLRPQTARQFIDNLSEFTRSKAA